MEKMKNTDILQEITPLSYKDCFYIADRNKKAFTYPMHCHEDFELNFVIHAPGVMRIVGDSREIIGDYDLVLISSPDLAHAWTQHKCTSNDIREITIQFQPSFLENLINTNQFVQISRMFTKARQGLCFPTDAIMKCYSIIDNLSKSKGFYAVVNFLTLLYELSLFTEQARVLSSSSYAKIENHSDSRRVNKIQNYIDEHYRENITLEEVSELIGMSKVAFSKFFKLRTGKTLIDFITDIRLGHACNLLVNSSMNISEICYECGFNNLSNFNRLFKKKKNCTPKMFRENYFKNKTII